MNEILKFYQNEWDESIRLSSQAGQIEYRTTLTYLTKYCKNDMNLFYSTTPELIEADLE